MNTKRILPIMTLGFFCLLTCLGCGNSKGEKTSSQQETAPGNTDLVTMEPADNAKGTDNDKNVKAADKSGDTGTRTASDHKEGSGIPSSADLDSQVEEFLEKMTLQEKVAQLFIVLPEAIIDTDVVTQAGSMTEEAINSIPVGGFIYMEQNLRSPEQVSSMLETVQQYSMDRIGLPMFTCVDEEGGTVARINNNINFNVPHIGNMSDIGASGDVDEAYRIGQELGTYLSELGFNLDFAPVADVLSNPDNEVIKARSFGSDPEMTAKMSMAVLRGLKENGVYGTLKHYPGHGATEGDTHEGYAYTSKSLDDLLSCELLPFERGIQEGADFIMAGHISLPRIIGDDTPASLSYKMLTEILRNQMDYNGIIITDGMNMGAISQTYSSADAAVKSIQAGADIILMPDDFTSAYQGVLNAVNNQIISVDRIDHSVTRILKAKLAL